MMTQGLEMRACLAAGDSVENRDKKCLRLQSDFLSFDFRKFGVGRFNQLANMKMQKITNMMMRMCLTSMVFP